MLRVYNTLTRKLEVFEPIAPPRVGMYVCGVTVYDTVHVGHARSYVNFDAIRRHLEFCGYEVKHVQNFTDIDDKIIERANREGRDWRELTAFYTAEYFRLMDRLGIKRAHHYPRATEYVPKMIEMVKGLVEKGHAYVTPSGDVYFDVSTFPEYGELAGKARLEQETVSRVRSSGEKRNPADFALWKAAKPGEPKWPSPWGEGRPGWHIECSAMSMDLLGESFDIHGGGHDLIFPHHTNEMAQSQCYTGKPMARYWLHNGFINMRGEKMSKSLGNFVTLEEAMDRHGAAALRMFILKTHYRSQLAFDISLVDEAAAALERLTEAVSDARTAMAHLPDSPPPSPTKSARRLAESADGLADAFKEAMDDDFNTPAALAVLFEHAQKVFSYVRSVTGPSSPGLDAGLLGRATGELERLLGVLGFAAEEAGYDAEALRRAMEKEGFQTPEGSDPLEEALRLRRSLREERKFEAADRIREAVKEATGFKVKDWPFATTVSRLRMTTERPAGEEASA